jgi:AdoMet dependent proline di-methyltransferase
MLSFTVVQNGVAMVTADLWAETMSASGKKCTRNSRSKASHAGVKPGDNSARKTTSIAFGVPPHGQESRDAAIKGRDDLGNFYNSHSELLEVQASNRDAFYESNAAWWQAGGYGGATDDEEMIGDEGGAADAEEGLAFLDRLVEANAAANALSSTSSPLMKHELAIDVGAGLGRITRGILLKRYDEIHLLEGNASYCKRSKLKLGKKKAKRCIFTHCCLQDMTAETLGARPADLIWIQWTLQYLIDVDVVKCLRTLALGLRPTVGVLIVKENRPYGTAREDRFQMDTPWGENERYDITRSDAHHQLLFQMAGLTVKSMERGKETNTYQLRNHGS